MMMMDLDISNAAGVAYASFVLIALSSITPIVRLIKRPYRVKSANENAIYEDKDGAATEESMARYTVKTQFIVIYTVAVLGLIESLALAVFATVRKENGFSELCLTQAWLLFPAWVSGYSNPIS